MKRFVVLYHTPPEAMAGLADVTPEEAQKGMEPWMNWAARCGSGLTDLGAPLGNGRQVHPGGADAIESTVTGYSMLQAEDMDAALAMLQDHPHLGWNADCEIQIFEVMPLPS